MTITAKIIADSTTTKLKDWNFAGGNFQFESNRLITVQLRYPRFIHAELMTHRVFSRNASSSRAIPVERLIQDILDDTAMPIHWGKNQPGMQAREEHDDLVFIYDDERFLNDVDGFSKEEAWLMARDNAIHFARAYAKSGYHKQIVNRLLEPFAHINVIVTSNQWSNFFELRNHPDAQPEIRVLAEAILEAIASSQPKFLQIGEWHLPYIIDEDYDVVWSLLKKDFGHDFQYKFYDMLARISTARCARVSYLTHDGKKPNVEKDLDLYHDLVVSEPLHASPAEHQAEVFDKYIKNSNFAQSRFMQHRKIIEDRKLFNLQ
jgi:thymidylate synthase ThyX